MNRLYEINTVVWIETIRKQHKKPLNIDQIPITYWHKIKDLGFDSVWLMGVWQRSEAAREINLKNNEFIKGMKTVLKSFKPQADLAGSAYSIKDYHVSPELGGDEALKSLKLQLNKLGLKLLVDFVPNHVAPDHQWTRRPELFIQGSEEQLAAEPGNYLRINGSIYAHGKDPEFPPWNDVLQLNAFSQSLRDEISKLVIGFSELCDGVRCDMAMLMLNDVFSRTWGHAAGDQPDTEYWQDIISRVKERRPDFVFIAESYWGTEQQLMGLGFDYCYDKELYDHILSANVAAIKNRLSLPVELQSKFLRFLENHDEARSSQIMSWPKHKSALLLLLSTPGLQLIYDGQMEGRKVKLPVHLRRAPKETLNRRLNTFYEKAMKALPTNKIHGWELINLPNDNLIACSWQAGNIRFYAAVNLTDQSIRLESDLLPPTARIYLNSSGLGKRPIKPSSSGVRLNLKPYQTIILTK